MCAIFAVVEPPNKNNSRFERLHVEVHAKMSTFACGIDGSDGYRLRIQRLHAAAFAQKCDRMFAFPIALIEE